MVLATFSANTAHAKPGHSYTDLRFKNNCDSPIQIAVSSQNLHTSSWQTNAWYQFAPGEGPARLNEVQTRNRYIYYYAESTDGSQKIWQGSNSGIDAHFTTSTGRRLYGKRLDTGDHIGQYTMNLNCPDHSLLVAIRSIPAFEISNDRAGGVRWSPQTMKVGLRISRYMLSGELGILGEIRPHFTDYNRFKLNRWTVNSIDNRGIQIAARWDYEKLERNYLTGGRWTTCTSDGTASVFAQLKRGKEQGLDINLSPGDFRVNGTGGLCIGMGQLAEWTVNFASLSYRIADLFGFLPSKYRVDLSSQLKDINSQIEKNRLVFDSANYDDQGVWINFSINEAKMMSKDPTLKLALQAFCRISGKCPGSANFSSGVNGVVRGEIKTTTTGQRQSENFSRPNNASPEQVTSNGVSKNPSKNKAGEVMRNTEN